MLSKVESGTILNTRYTLYDPSDTIIFTRFLGTVFIILCTILCLLLTFIFYKKRKHFPIRGRAPYITLLTSFFSDIVLVCPPISAVLWIYHITKVRCPSNVHILTKILASMHFVSRKLAYPVWFIKI